MRRIATCLFMSVLIAPLLVAGCKSSGKESAAGDPLMNVVDPYTPPVEEAEYESDRYPVYGSSVPVESTYDPPATSSGFQPRHHTVVKTDTLYALARQYYGDQGRWKDIYEANRSTISDPNKIRVGQRLLIP